MAPAMSYHDHKILIESYTRLEKDALHIHAALLLYIHAIGAGISLLEFQHNADITYRLYDYGRPRELHLDDGVAVSKPQPYPLDLAQHVPYGGTRLLVDGPHFCLVRVEDPAAAPPSLPQRRRWVMPLRGTVSSGQDQAGPGECLLLDGGAPLCASADAELLIGAQGSLGPV